LAAEVAESAGVVWVAPEPPLTPLPRVEGIEGLECAPLPVMVARAGAGLLADNFLDIAHFPFVHAATFGAADVTTVEDYQVERGKWSCQATYEHPFQNQEDPGVASGERPLLQTRRMTYRYQAPFALSLHLEYLDTGVVNVIGFFVQPEAVDRCRIHSYLWRNDLHRADMTPAEQAAYRERVVDFEVAVVKEDLALHHRFGDLSLPLHLPDEVHTRADRITVALRRVLADLVSEAC
jgi:phenylpropionate dioxygenase-like ring-hydroxylating dioxygenase large terminal subunit